LPILGEPLVKVAKGRSRNIEYFESTTPSHALTDFQGACETGRIVVGLFLRCCDFAYRWLHGLTDPAAEAGPVLRVEVARYRGDPRTLADGTEIRPGDRIGILHLHNERVARLHGDGNNTSTAGLKFRRTFVASLRELARRLGESERYAGVKAFMAETIFHQGTRHVGFEILPLRGSARSRLVATYERVLVAHYHPLGRRRVRRLRVREARAIWISRNELLRRYGSESSVPSDTSS